MTRGSVSYNYSHGGVGAKARELKLWPPRATKHDSEIETEIEMKGFLFPDLGLRTVDVGVCPILVLSQRWWLAGCSQPTGVGHVSI